MLEYSLVAGDHGMAGVDLVVWGNTVTSRHMYVRTCTCSAGLMLPLKRCRGKAVRPIHPSIMSLLLVNGMMVMVDIAGR